MPPLHFLRVGAAFFSSAVRDGLATEITEAVAFFYALPPVSAELLAASKERRRLHGITSSRIRD